MEFISKTNLSLFASASLLCLSATALAERHAQHSPGATVSASAFLGASLTGASGFTGAGSFEYLDGSNGGNLHARIFLPVDGVTIADSNTAVTDAADNLVVLKISNGSNVLATYNLAIKDIDFTYSNADTVAAEKAEYVVSARQSGATYTVNFGSSTSSILPTLAAGDTVSVYLNNSSTPILTGTLAAGVTPVDQ